MKTNQEYAEIASLEDFKLEKERLLLKAELIETRLRYNFEKIRNVFSVTSMVFSFAKEFIIPKISDFFGNLFNKAED